MSSNDSFFERNTLSVAGMNNAGTGKGPGDLFIRCKHHNDAGPVLSSIRLPSREGAPAGGDFSQGALLWYGVAI
jgi:hypothetical protein